MASRSARRLLPALAALLLLVFLGSWRALQVDNSYYKTGKASVSVLLQATGFTDADGSAVQRFHWAMQRIHKARRWGVFPVWHCSKKLGLGRRPVFETPDRVGTTCEPWMVRDAITLLDMLLLPGDAKALEWSSGSSTLWLLLGRTRFLYSIEHDGAWAPSVVSHLNNVLGEKYLKEHWSMHHIPATQQYNAATREDPSIFSAYVAAAFLDDSHLGTFDYVSIDGRARTACFARALQLLKPHGGILVLDNAERPEYQAGIAGVPRHWLRRDFTRPDRRQRQKGDPPRAVTTVWVSCHVGSCGRR